MGEERKRKEEKIRQMGFDPNASTQGNVNPEYKYKPKIRKKKDEYQKEKAQEEQKKEEKTVDIEESKKESVITETKEETQGEALFNDLDDLMNSEMVTEEN